MIEYMIGTITKLQKNFKNINLFWTHYYNFNSILIYSILYYFVSYSLTIDISVEFSLYVIVFKFIQNVKLIEDGAFLSPLQNSSHPVSLRIIEMFPIKL